jgi:hypothetical protein
MDELLFWIQLSVTPSLGVFSGATEFARGRNARRHHHCSVVLFGASGYRGVAAMIAAA